MNRSLPRNSAPIFWAALATVAGAALALSWPGFATHDTIFLIQEAERGRFTTYHPLLNGLLLWLMAVPAKSFAPYTIFQVLICTLLLGRSAHLVSPPGVRWTRWATFALWGASFPTVLFLGMIWKDVPLAYALTYVGALAYRLRSDSNYQVGRLDAILLVTSVVFATALRHGTVINLVLIPCLLGLSRVAASRRLWLPCAAAAVVWVVLSMLGRSSIVQNDPVHLKRLQIAAVSQPFLSIVSNKNGYASDDVVFDDQLARHVFGDQYAQRYTPDYFRNEVAPLTEEQLDRAYRSILARTPRLCAMNFGSCVSPRVQMMLGTLQPTTKFGGMTFYDLGSFQDCDSTFGMTAESCAAIHRYASGERSLAAARRVDELRAKYADRRTAFTTLFAWNLLPALFLLLSALVLLPPRHVGWVVCAFFAVQLGLPFATAMANDFRYYYFLSPFFAIFAPVFLRDAADAVRRVKLVGTPR